MSLMRRITLTYMGCCGLAGAASFADLSTHNGGPIHSTGSLIADIIAGALLGSTTGAIMFPYMVVENIYDRYCKNEPTDL